MSGEGDSSKKLEMDNSDYAALSALLDFYSDRATAHASLFVACVFGLFTILAILEKNIIILSLAYWFLFGSGLYELLNFGQYAKDADVIKRYIEIPKEKLVNDIKKQVDKESFGASKSIKREYQSLKEFVYRRIGLLGMILLYSVFVGLLPFLAVFFPMIL